MLSHRARNIRWVVVDSFNYRMSFMDIGLSKLKLKNTDGCSCHQLWLKSLGNCDILVLWPLLQIPLCKQRSGLIAYGGAGCGIGINFSQSYFQPLPRHTPSLLLGPVLQLLLNPSYPTFFFTFVSAIPPTWDTFPFFSGNLIL